MPDGGSMADYAARGGYANDAQTSRNLNNGGSVSSGSSSGGSSNVTSRRSTNVTPTPALAPTPAPTPPASAPYGSDPTAYRWMPDADYSSRLDHFSSNTRDAQSEILALKDMWNAASGNTDRQSEISGWADQVRGAANINTYDPTYGSSYAPIGSRIQNTDTNPNVVTHTVADGSSNNAPASNPTNNAPGTPAQPELIKGPDGTVYGVKLADGTFMPYKQAGAAGAAATGAAAALPAAQQVIQQQQGQSSTSNDLMKMFQSALQTAGNPNDPYWNPIKDLANQQASGILQGKQQQLDSARAGIDDQFFQKYLGERQQLANRGLGNSGLANDSDFRLQLAKQGQLADMYSKLGTFDQNQISADQFKGLYDSTNKTMIDKANALQQAYGNAAQYDKMNTSDILKTLFNYDQLGTQDKWKDVEMNYNYDKMNNDNANNNADRVQKAAEFNQKLTVDQQTELAKLGFQYDNMDEQHRQFYDKLSNDKLVEAAKDRVEWAKVGLDATKVYGVDEKGNLTLDAKRLAEEVRSHQVGEIFNQDKLTAEVANWTKQNDLAASKYNLDRESLSRKTDYDNSMIDKAKDATSSEMTKMALDGMKAQMNEVRQRIDDKLKADPKADVSDLITKSDNISKEITGLINSGKPAGGK